ncbi:glycosyl transferase family protein [Alkanindiges sp. WGS2144]|uniref:glycosyl transferase family protein n=1 Tax=Alkanindiges sp. WGS2144 TaxID=3366808 RepID=UPI0037522FDC
MTTRPRPQSNIYKDHEHPFAQYVRILGKGKRSSRSLTYEEAYQAFGMILDREVLDIQLGAFLTLLRVKEESVEELAGFVQATRDHLQLPAIVVDLDWSSYAGKRKHYPWFLLAALTLARHGYRVFMHGAAGHTINRLYTEDVLAHLGYQPCHNMQAVEQALAQHNFAYMPLSAFAPRLSEIIEMRNILGVRSPVHTLVRLINPFNAPVTLQAIFHPAYRASHQQAAMQLGYQNTAVIKGEGGEFERNPDARTLMLGIQDGQSYELEWPMINTSRSEAEESFDLNYFIAVWRGETSHDYGQKAVTGTLALALYSLQKADSIDTAMQLAAQMWQQRLH